MTDEISAQRPPDPATLRWMANMLANEAVSLKDKMELVASGSDRIGLGAQISTMVQIANKCWGTAEAVEKEAEAPKVVLTDAQ